MLMIGIVRLAAGADWRPPGVGLQTADSSAVRDFEGISSACLAFEQPESSIVMPRALLHQSIAPPKEECQVPIAGFESWKSSAPAGDFVGSVVQVVETLSWDGYPDIHRTADLLGLSVRTLQRQLSEAGCTHESLIRQVRFRTAVALLRETDTKILDIALDVGYSDHAHFTRAFMKWAGCAPQEYRRRFRPEAAEPDLIRDVVGRHRGVAASSPGRRRAIDA
jgi:AraC-like DNA-binding protein